MKQIATNYCGKEEGKFMNMYVRKTVVKIGDDEISCIRENFFNAFVI